MDVIKAVKSLDLAMGEYAVVGSGAMAARNLRPANDVDLVVTPEAYERLKSDGWREELYPDPWRETGIFYGPFDASTTWSIGDFQPDPNDLIKNADVIDGVAFMKLEAVLAWKMAAHRDKDIDDIKLIEAYLKQK